MGTRTCKGVDDPWVIEWLKSFYDPLTRNDTDIQFVGSIASRGPTHMPATVLAKTEPCNEPFTEKSDRVHHPLQTSLDRLRFGQALHGLNGPPFDRSKVRTQATRNALGQLANVRFIDIDGFLKGVSEAVGLQQLPTRTQSALLNLEEIRVVMYRAGQALGDPTKSADPSDMAALRKNIDTLTLLAQHEMNLVINAALDLTTRLNKDGDTRNRTIH